MLRSAGSRYFLAVDWRELAAAVARWARFGLEPAEAGGGERVAGGVRTLFLFWRGQARGALPAPERLMILKRQVLLKAVVTDRLKEELIQSVDDAIARVVEEQEELDRQSRRLMLELQRTDMNRAMAFRQQLEAEKRKRDDLKAALQEQRQAYEALELGTEFERGTLESDVEVKVGDNIQAKLGQAEILVEDDIIKEIRDAAQ